MADEGPGPDGGEARASKDTAGARSSGTVHLVVQRCARARLLVDAEKDAWAEVGRGLVLYVSFAQGAAGVDEGRLLRQVAKSALTAPLSTSDKWRADHSDAQSIVALCREGEAQSLLVVPQASLVAKLEAGDRNLKYYNQCAKEDARRLYHGFVEALGSVARELICGTTTQAKPLDAGAYNDLMAKRAEAALIPPDQWFKVGENEGKYSRFDERGVPTHGADGEELAKSAVKKLEKVFAGQEKKFAKASAGGGIAAQGAAKEATAGAPAAEELPLPEGMVLPEVRSGTFGGRQGFELTTSGPFTHAFVF